jgi:hypothetical protein
MEHIRKLRGDPECIQLKSTKASAVKKPKLPLSAEDTIDEKDMKTD